MKTANSTQTSVLASALFAVALSAQAAEPVLERDEMLADAGTEIRAQAAEALSALREDNRRRIEQAPGQAVALERVERAGRVAAQRRVATAPFDAADAAAR